MTNKDDNMITFCKNWSKKWNIPEMALVEFNEYIIKNIAPTIVESMKDSILALFKEFEDR